ncbi:MAG TPA: YHS domain-containing (seleno)protein [Vicinamibacterales bacterium]|nr:YHS domain-containing (seleno)protein [Vicinamibacterales bacterium]
MSVRLWQHVMIIAALALSVVVSEARGQKSAVNQDVHRLALKGYDPVAYSDAGRPIKGIPEFQHQWQGAVWRFATAANKARFVADPEKYAPQFGGYCSWAVSRGYTADIDPEAWRIVDGKLYLNYSKSVQRRWEQDIPGNISKAVANWPAVLR